MPAQIRRGDPYFIYIQPTCKCHRCSCLLNAEFLNSNPNKISNRYYSLFSHCQSNIFCIIRQHIRDEYYFT